MSYNHISYITPIWNLAANRFNPKRILELGCGCSSYVMRWLWPNAEMVVIDDHAIWMRLLNEMGGYHINKIMYEKTKEGILNQLASNGKFDFIFVDSGHLYNDSGKWRVDFMKYIRENEVINPEGIMVLHDANRPEYQEESNNWPHCLKLKVYATYIMTMKKLKYKTMKVTPS